MVGPDLPQKWRVSGLGIKTLGMESLRLAALYLGVLTRLTLYKIRTGRELKRMKLHLGDIGGFERQSVKQCSKQRRLTRPELGYGYGFARPTKPVCDFAMVIDKFVV